MRQRAGIPWVITTLVAVLFAGCGGGERPEDVVKTHLSALAEDDAARACDQMTGAARRQIVDDVRTALPELEATNCQEAYSELLKNMGGDEKASLEDARIAGVSTSGDTARVEVAGADQDAELVRRGGRWYIDGGFFGPGENANAAQTPVAEATEQPDQSEKVRDAVEDTLSRSGTPGFAGFVDTYSGTGQLIFFVKKGTPAEDARALCEEAAEVIRGEGYTEIEVRELKVGEKLSCQATP